MFLLTLCLLATVAFLAYLWINRKYNYWSRLGIDGPAPSLLNFGNTAQIQGQDPIKVELELQKKFGTVYGTYSGLKPTLTVSEPELIKAILVKDFPSFANRRVLTTFHPTINNALLFSESQAWKRFRSVASPTFTTGKLKRFRPMIHKAIDNLEGYFDRLTGSECKVMKDVRTTIVGFTIETIALTMFAAKTGSNDDRKEVNAFVKHGKTISDVPNYQLISYFAMPKWFNKLFNIEHPFNVESTDFYTGITKAIISGQKEKNHKNNLDLTSGSNMVELLVNAAQNKYTESSSYEGLAASMDEEFTELPEEKTASTKADKPTLTDEEILGVATGIFLAGFDTTALIISSALYELARAEENIQEKLFQELKTSLDSLNPESEEYFEVIMKLPYLDAVIKETLRMYPALARLERRVTAKTYNLGGKIPLVKDQLVEISVFGVHYNEQIYPEPFRFRPDRFLPENKHLLVPYSFLAFGEGSRNCMGMRFAYQEIKLCMARILRQYRFQTTPDTPRQLTFLPFKFVLNSPPFPLKVAKRC